MSRRIGGFGLDIMQGLMDDVDICLSSNGTTVTMVKMLMPSSHNGRRDDHATRRGA
jgi:anti-sigma regulatory factor (Ser/Thr protein kinase)